MKWKPADVIACIIVLGCIAMICLGIDSHIKWTLLAMTGAYYGIDMTPFIKMGRRQSRKEEDK